MKNKTKKNNCFFGTPIMLFILLFVLLIFQFTNAFG